MPTCSGFCLKYFDKSRETWDILAVSCCTLTPFSYVLIDIPCFDQKEYYLFYKCLFPDDKGFVTRGFLVGKYSQHEVSIPMTFDICRYSPFDPKRSVLTVRGYFSDFAFQTR